jgi:uncharacterized protein (TIGR02996 family)
MTEAELLDAIDANPDDDAPRLAHADWLEANGHKERAEFIRADLRGEHVNGWDLARAMPRVHGMLWDYRRGYPEVVRFASHTAFKKGWPLAVKHRARHVIFNDLRNPAKLADEPALLSIRSLELRLIDSAAALTILRLPRLRLRHLSVLLHPEDLDFLVVLADLPALAGLRSLHYSFWSNGLPERPLAAFLASPYLGHLRELRLQGWLGAEAMRALWHSTSLSGLTSLEVLGGSGWSSETKPGGLQELGDGRAMPALERVRLGYSDDGTGPGEAVAAAIHWTRLRVLDLSGHSVGDAGAVALAGATHLSRLESLVLPNCKLSDAGAIALASSPYLSCLSLLNLSGNVIGRAGINALGRTESLPRLRTTFLHNNPAPDALIEAVQVRFREGGPPLEETAPAPALPVAASPSAPQIGEADEDGLVRAIWADPFDEVPRLVYADWLDERGSHLHAAILRARGAERSKHWEALVAHMQGSTPWEFMPSLSGEGLVGVVMYVRSLRAKTFQRDCPAWLRRHHIVKMTVWGASGNWADFFSCDWLAHTRGLSFYGNRFDAVDALAASPHLAGLASLTLNPNWVPLDRLASLFRDGGLRGLCHLARPDTTLELNTLQAIADAPFAPHLRHLAVGRMTEEPMAFLGESSTLAGLVTLSLEVFGDSEAKALADAAGLVSLRNLDLTGSWFLDVGADALVNSPLLKQLRFLRLKTAHHAPAMERLARAIPLNCRVVLAEGSHVSGRDALVAVLGDRLIVE